MSVEGTTGQHVGKVQEDTLRGIALALDLPYRKVREAAATASVVPAEFRLPKRAGRLSSRQRRIILSMIDSMLDEQTSLAMLFNVARDTSPPATVSASRYVRSSSASRSSTSCCSVLIQGPPSQCATKRLGIR